MFLLARRAVAYYYACPRHPPRICLREQPKPSLLAASVRACSRLDQSRTFRFPSKRKAHTCRIFSSFFCPPPRSLLSTCSLANAVYASALCGETDKASRYHTDASLLLPRTSAMAPRRKKQSM